MTPRSVITITEPLYEPVSLADAKIWCRVDDGDTSQDAVIRLLIKAARERAEEVTGRAFVERTVEMKLDAFPDSGKPIELLLSPVQSVTWVHYYDTAGTEQTVADTLVLDTASAPARLAMPSGTSWPGTQDRIAAVSIRYVCGYAPGSPSDEAAYQEVIPARVRNWMEERISTANEFREQLLAGQVAELPRDFVDGLLDGLRVHRLFA